MRKHKNKIIAGIGIALVLAFVYWWGGNSPGLSGNNPQTDNAGMSETQSPLPLQSVTPESIDEAKEITGEISANKADESTSEESMPQSSTTTPMTASEKIALADKTAKDKTAESSPTQPERADIGNREESETKTCDTAVTDKYNTKPIPEGKPEPIEPGNAVITDKELSCTLSVRCDTILKNIAWLDKEKLELVPKDGVIYAEQAVTFYEGESVFNLLVREMKRNKIHIEFENTPIYNSAYIEGIGNLYELDCGELSGWMYKVNDWFPNYGCSRYRLKAGDKVEWVYSCDLGTDVGGNYSARNGR